MPPMIVRFSVDSHALWTSAPETLFGISNDRRLIQCWQDRGILFHEEDFGSSLRALPPLRRALWQDALHINRHALLPLTDKALSKVETDKDLEDFLGQLDLACLDDARALIIGMPDEEISFWPVGVGLEVCRIDHADQSRAFVESKEASRKSINPGTRVDDVWRDRFATLASYCRHVTLVDRYCIERHKYCLNRRSSSGLRKIITELGKAGNKHSLKVFCSDYNCEGRDAITLLKDLVQTMNQGGLNSVTLHIAPERFFKACFHYRYLRFDKTMCQLDTGSEALEGTKVRKLCTFGMRPFIGSEKQLERDLMKAAEEFLIL